MLVFIQFFAKIVERNRHDVCRRRYGLEFVRFVLALVWYERRTEAFLRGCRVTKEFESHVGSFSKGTMKCAASMTLTLTRILSQSGP